MPVVRRAPTEIRDDCPAGASDRRSCTIRTFYRLSADASGFGTPSVCPRCNETSNSWRPPPSPTERHHGQLQHHPLRAHGVQTRHPRRRRRDDPQAPRAALRYPGEAPSPCLSWPLPQNRRGNHAGRAGRGEHRAAGDRRREAGARAREPRRQLTRGEAPARQRAQECFLRLKVRALSCLPS